MMDSTYLTIGYSWAAATILFCVLFLLAGEVAAQPGELQAAWIAQQATVSGLVIAFDDETTRAPLYGNCLAAIVFVDSGRPEMARGILDAASQIYYQSASEGLSQGSSGLLYDQRYADDPLNSGYGNFRTGENAWVVIAINFYETISSDSRYGGFADDLLGAIGQYRVEDASDVAYGAFRWGPGNSALSTEFQLDIYSALSVRAELTADPLYEQQASDLRQYLTYNSGYPFQVGVTRVWLDYADPVFNGEIYNGSDVIFLDAQAWAVLSLYPPQGSEPDFTGVLTSIDEGGAWQAIGATVVCGTQEVTGFSDEFLPGGTDENWVWLEGTEFMSAAYQLIGNSTRSQFYHNEVGSLLQPNGSLYHSCATDGVYTDDQWPENHRFGAVTTTSWYYFVESGVNPFQPVRMSSVSNFRLY